MKVSKIDRASLDSINTTLHTEHLLGYTENTEYDSIFLSTRLQLLSPPATNTTTTYDLRPRLQHTDLESVSPSDPSPQVLPMSTLQSTAMETLPSELLIQIFQSANTFTTAQTLSKTSHHLHNIWNANAAAILPHVVECFPQARELAVAQEQKHIRQPWLGMPQRSMSIAQRVAANVAEASMTCAHFEACIVQASKQDEEGIPPRDNISSSERADFTQAYYRALTLAATGRMWTISRVQLASLDLLEYLQMREVTNFIDSMCKTSTLDCGTSPPTVRHDILDVRVLVALIFLDHRLQALRAYPDDIEGRLGSQPNYYFVLSDGYMKNGGAARSVRMADLLPLVKSQFRFM